VTFDIMDCYECQARNLVEIGQKVASLLLIFGVRFIVASDIIWHKSALFEWNGIRLVR